MIVFDTSAVIDFLRGGTKTKSLVESIEKTGNTVAVTSVSLFELLSPIHHRRLWKEEKAVRAFVRQTVLLDLDANAATEASKIMGALLRLGKPINALDTLIAGISVSNGAEKIVTSDSDLGEVAKVADIRIHFL
jgi:predicted nucleic acid-binding protein